ncbi:MAG TPA: trimethylamine methyltransferase family protein [Patescibacteria group bacterium]|nr:trimethylamine methyltransferase family protein [Patescibacteria group bacterium]
MSPATGPEPLRPVLRLLGPDLVGRILDEAHELLRDDGIRVQDEEAVRLLADAGAAVAGEVVRIPTALVEGALATAPASFDLFDRAGRPAVRYGAGVVQFDPGSSGVNVLDPLTGDHRPSQAADLVRLVRVAEMLPAYAAQSTAIVCGDVPAEIGDLYRLFLVLLGSAKPVVTGAFSPGGTAAMIDLLALDAGGREALAARPRAVFDVCPSPPLTWTAFGARNLVDLARARVPAEIVSMPLAGGAAPVTLVGSVVQHAAECLAGIAIHQLAGPGAPIVWGGAPSIVDMRTGATPMGAIETAMLDAAYSQVGKVLNLPTHGYLGATDGKVIDHQAGLESGMGALIGALAGIDMISGSGMLDSLRCQSAEKLVLDAEGITMAQRLVRGVATPTEALATAMIRAAGPEARFLELPETRRLFRSEQALPSAVIDRGSLRAWEIDGRPNASTRARARVDELLTAYARPALDPSIEAAMEELIREAGAPFGLPEELPGILAALA